MLCVLTGEQRAIGTHGKPTLIWDASQDLRVALLERNGNYILHLYRCHDISWLFCYTRVWLFQGERHVRAQCARI